MSAMYQKGIGNILLKNRTYNLLMSEISCKLPLFKGVNYLFLQHIILCKSSKAITPLS